MRRHPSILLRLVLLAAMCALLWPLATWLAGAMREPGTGFTSARILRALDHERAFARAFETAALVTLACVVVGYPVAYALARLSRGWGGVGIALLLIQFCLWLLLDAVPHPWTTWPMVLALMVAPLVRAMRRITPTELRAAASLGANGPGRFRFIILPLTLPGLATGALLVFVVSATLAIRPVLTLEPNPGLATALAAMFVLLTGAIIAIAAMLLPRAPVRAMEID